MNLISFKSKPNLPTSDNSAVEDCMFRINSKIEELRLLLDRLNETKNTKIIQFPIRKGSRD